MSFTVPETLPEMTGQMLMTGFEGTRLTAETEALIREHHIGGVILFPRNFENPAQLYSLLSDLQALARETAPGWPLFVSVDQEGGKVARLSEPFTDFPEPGCLGRADSEELAGRFGRALGRELASVGINMDHAPVLDVNTRPENPVIGTRAFSTDPLRAGALAVSFLKGLQENGVLGVGKHFPGHGDTTADSHLELPCVMRDTGTLEQVELLPFAWAVHNGLQAIMTAHVVYPAWDPENPATFSPVILQTVLRRDLRFEGLIISDDLEMKAVEKHLRFEQLPRRGVAAGLDIFLLCNDPEKVKALHRTLVADLEQGTVDAAAVRRSVQRIAAVKAGLPPHPAGPPDPALWREEHRALAAEMAAFRPA